MLARARCEAERRPSESDVVTNRELLLQHAQVGRLAVFWRELPLLWIEIVLSSQVDKVEGWQCFFHNSVPSQLHLLIWAELLDLF